MKKHIVDMCYYANKINFNLESWLCSINKYYISIHENNQRNSIIHKGTK